MLRAIVCEHVHGDPLNIRTEGKMNDERLLLTIPEVAVKLGLGRSFVYQMVRAGTLRSVKLGRARRVSTEVLRRWVEEQADTKA